MVTASGTLNVRVTVIRGSCCISLLLERVGGGCPSVVFGNNASLSGYCGVVDEFSRSVSVNVGTSGTARNVHGGLGVTVGGSVSSLNLRLSGRRRVVAEACFGGCRIACPVVSSAFVAVGPCLCIRATIFVGPFPCRVEGTSACVCHFLGRRGLSTVVGRCKLRPFRLGTRALAEAFVSGVFTVNSCCLGNGGRHASERLCSLCGLVSRVAFGSRFCTLFSRIERVHSASSTYPSTGGSRDVGGVVNGVVGRSCFGGSCGRIASGLLFRGISCGAMGGGLSRVCSRLGS